jgi:hypothetical protein
LAGPSLLVKSFESLGSPEIQVSSRGAGLLGQSRANLYSISPAHERPERTGELAELDVRQRQDSFVFTWFMSCSAQMQPWLLRGMSCGTFASISCGSWVASQKIRSYLS